VYRDKEVPVDRIVYKEIEVEVERLVTKEVEVPVTKIIKEYVEVPVEKIVEREVTVPVEKIVVQERIVEVRRLACGLERGRARALSQRGKETRRAVTLRRCAPGARGARRGTIQGGARGEGGHCREDCHEGG
jgi:hypothetical protein